MHLKFYFALFFFFYISLALSFFFSQSVNFILGPAVLSSEPSGGNSSIRQGAEHKKSVTFDDGVKPGAESTPPSAAAAAATNIMSSHKIRSNETDIDQVSLFKPGLIEKYIE